MVELQDVSFSYTKEVGTLTHVDLTIRPGECVLLCGAFRLVSICSLVAFGANAFHVLPHRAYIGSTKN